MVIYIIQMSLIDKKTLKTKGFTNLWGCSTEERARKECIFLQTNSNKYYETHSIKFIYKYEAVFIYKN